MSNINGYEVSVKDYATQRNKTVQAVYQQMKRGENAVALEGHIIVRRVGNKDVKFLDEKAVEILDESSRSTPTVLLQEDLKSELEAVSQDLDLAQKNLVFYEGQMKALKDLLAEKEKELRALAAPQMEIERLTAQNAEIKAERDEYRGKIAEADQRALKANSEAYNAKLYAAKLETYLKQPKIVQLFTKKPVLKNLEEEDKE